MWAAIDFVNQLEILEILAKSLQQSRNRLLLVEDEKLLYGEALPLVTSTLWVGRASEDRIILESTISKSQVSFELKVKLKRCVERGVVLRAAYAKNSALKNLKARKESNVTGNVSGSRSRRMQTKFRINAINSYKGYFVLVLQRFFRKGFLCSLNDL